MPNRRSPLEIFIAAIVALLVFIIAPYIMFTNWRIWYNSIGVNDFVVIICIIIFIILVLIRLYVGPGFPHIRSVGQVTNADDIYSDDSKYIPSEVKRQVMMRDHERCVICGSKRNLEYDHDIPVSKGGSNTVNNIRILCKDCNRSKSGKIE